MVAPLRTVAPATPWRTHPALLVARGLGAPRRPGPGTGVGLRGDVTDRRGGWWALQRARRAGTAQARAGAVRAQRRPAHRRTAAHDRPRATTPQPCSADWRWRPGLQPVDRALHGGQPGSRALRYLCGAGRIREIHPLLRHPCDCSVICGSQALWVVSVVGRCYAAKRISEANRSGGTSSAFLVEAGTATLPCWEPRQRSANPMLRATRPLSRTSEPRRSRLAA
jgi:hypothetical protein